MLRSELSLQTSQCKLFHPQLRNLEPGHSLEALIELLDRNKCISKAELEVKMDQGSPIATLLMGRRSSDPSAFFLGRLRAKKLETVWSTAKGLLTNHETINELRPSPAFAEQLSLRLSAKKQNFYVLRLIKILVKKMSADNRKRLSKAFINNLTPHATGDIGSINPDALIVFELMNTPQTRSIIATTLKNLKPGQVKIKLMNRFGQVLR